MANDVATIDVVVRDGSTVCLRRAAESDVPRCKAPSTRSPTTPAITGSWDCPPSLNREFVLIQYWAEDPRTSVILLYLESFGNPKKFSEIARRVARTKPIVAVKAGRSSAGSRAASSHAGALASSDTVVDALFHQAGVIRTERLEELFDVAALLANQPVPRGRRVAILTNAGGPGILAADACEAHGLVLPVLGDATRAELRSFLPAAASVGNPVDMLASAPADHYRRALAAILATNRSIA